MLEWPYDTNIIRAHRMPRWHPQRHDVRMLLVLHEEDCLAPHGMRTTAPMQTRQWFSGIKPTWEGRDAEDAIHMSDCMSMDQGTLPLVSSPPPLTSEISPCSRVLIPTIFRIVTMNTAELIPITNTIRTMWIQNGPIAAIMSSTQSPQTRQNNLLRCSSFLRLTQFATTETKDQQNAQQDPRSPYRGRGQLPVYLRAECHG